ncbi:ABC transporter ATP-binding protein [Natrialbaceae archaeon AArc-T1-2]|uniref:ABC transporter ATP-binding protein n=1 Tax=Natrialbaceae archaeon AArc-T1-2 TaxID=3053904 RepID=UPI00255B2FBB|nr:ABC transporter ATP-binding protein [Natrialbaceae archaeon AArc-T1-2]WIV66404.1 ABC transporter ATP-binding protein [Natrialbaceae archaeon AArc-T1-2]
MITFEHVTKQYADGTVAIEDVSFTVEEGTTTVLVGPSGCGKTTTMKLVNRLEDPTEGTVYRDGTPISEFDPIELRRNTGYVIQEIGLFDHMTVGDNVATVPKLNDWDEEAIDARVDELLELMDLPPAKYRNQHPTELSGGQRQRVGVARALASDPDVLLMDEPFGALDPITRESLQDEFLKIQDELETTILFVTHSIDEALKMGDRIAIFDVGEVVQYDTPQTILDEPKSEFVEDFIGSDRPLKKLKVTRVEDVMSATTEGFTAAADGGTGTTATVQGNGGSTVDALEPTDTALSALSRLVASDVGRLPVVEDGEVVGTVSNEEISRSNEGARP